MGSSSGKKHKKDKKHNHRSRSHERQHRGPDEEVTLDLTDDSTSTRHKHHKHKKHKEHRHKHHKQKERERPSEVISLEESDSDSSDCVEVPIEQVARAKVREPPARERDLPAREREPSAREREPLVREREQHARERDPNVRERELPARDREPLARERDHEITAPPPPQISKHVDYERERRRERETERERESRRRGVKDRERGRGSSRSQSPTASHQPHRQRSHSPKADNIASRKRGNREREPGRERERERARSRSRSPIPESGAGDVLSIAETNKLRAKLGLKPLEVDTGSSKSAPSNSSNSQHENKRSGTDKDLSSYKDEWGEFLHKPADNIKEKKEAEKLRDKLKQRKEKRFLEERLARIRTLGESDEETDNVSKWVDRNKRVVNQREEALRKAKELEELDEAFGVADIVEQEKQKARQLAYGDRNLKGLRVEHDVDDFGEGRTVILTLKDQDVLNEEEGDTLVNVNMIDDERYKKNVANKKLNPLSYGYNVYEEQYDELGNPIERSVLEKYDEDIEGQPQKRKNFLIGENMEEEREHKRKLLEIKTKLAGKRLETLQDTNIKLASDTFSVEELATFKKPKKKIKKLRQKLKAEDLEPISELSGSSNLGSRQRSYREADENVNMPDESKPQIKLEQDDNDDLERVLSKARKLKQKENIIKTHLPIDVTSITHSVKPEPVDDATAAGGELLSGADGNIVLNATAEFCRTLGDIPTYGMAGNRNEDSNDMMDFDRADALDEHMDSNQEEPTLSHGTWNSVNPDEVMQPADLDNLGDDIEERAILDEEPDVGAGVANALRLALSKGYLEKEEKNRPSNTKMAHLQAKNYSIEDKAAGEDDKIGRRDRFHAGPIMEFKDKETFKPNVKLDYIDDNGRILNLKEAFRYLSHKFHGKGPGKNKIEKRLKKMEQDGLMKTMSSTDTPLCTLTMLQQKQKETKTPYVVLSGSNKTTAGVSGASISKFK
ncbi:U4/U6.U5 tri-snRNP-associated protein 1 [Drosophila montana]|uniref:U4/U6.U5 tri-snRNP-associated protein 1 n=1 Tax=Drosophila montana TaxID=40370 RepID=UPI00313E114E